MSNNHDIAIIGGAGHVGLPLAFFLAKKKCNVLVVDKDKNKIDLIKNKKLPFIEEGLGHLIKNQDQYKIDFTTNISKIINSKIIIITLGTPIDEFLNPDYRTFFNIFNEITKYLNNTQTIILRSTLAPGTTRKIIELLKKKNIKAGVAFCPERISQGKGVKELAALPQIISYSNLKTKKICTQLFKKMTKNIIECSFEEAEVAKLFCNSWRYLKFAIANEFYKICESNSLSFENVRRAMVQDYDRAKDFPTSGFAAGPCLLKDTMQLSSFSRQIFTFGHSAMLVNESLPEFIVDEFKRKINIKNKNVAILGMAFKPENDDSRDSLAFKLKKKLETENCKVHCHDPFMDRYKKNKLSEILKKCKIVFIGCPHKVYSKIKYGKNIKVINCWGSFNQ
jgi:UDP-N-acetyl-D-mannosaminuronic acid dehydrogenase